jgi:lysophospholipase L1-like esterase
MTLRMLALGAAGEHRAVQRQTSDGTFARPDGSHFSKANMPVVAKMLAQRIASAVK